MGALSAAPHAVLLSAKGYPIAQLADIIDADRDTVSGWLDVWEQFGLLGLRDRHRPGRPRKGTEADREQLFQAVQAAPHQLRALPLQFQERTGFSVSRETIRRWLKERGWAWRNKGDRFQVIHELAFLKG